MLGSGEIAPEPVALRVYEIAGDTPQAFYDVTEEDSRVLQVSAAQRQLDLFSQGLTKVLEAVGEVEQEAELRVFCVPALNFEALWISYGDEGRDLIVPLHAVDRLVQNEPVPMRDAMEALREAARPLANMDDTMGA